MGNKASDTWVGNVVTGSAGSYSVHTGTTTETYANDAMGRVTDISRDGQIVDQRKYDNGGRAVQSGLPQVNDQDYLKKLYGVDGDGQLKAGNGSEVHKTLYDTNGRQRAEQVTTTGSVLRYANFFTDQVTGESNYDNAGNLKGYTYSSNEGGKPVWHYTYGYTPMEGYRQTTVQADWQGEDSHATTTQRYDGNGFLIGMTQVQTGGQLAGEPQTSNRTYVNDASGKVLYAKDVITDAAHLNGDNGHVQRQLIVNGEVLGRYGETLDTDQSTSTNKVYTTTADFGFAFTAAGGNTPVIAPTSHTVAAGDSLQSIAQAAYGDANLWYRIAEANGIGGSDNLLVGQVIKIPPTQVSSNNASTFKPYDPSQVQGSMNPTLPTPAAQEACGGMGQIITLVVVVVVAYFTQQWQLLEQGMAAVEAVGEVAASTVSNSVLISMGSAVPGGSIAAGVAGGVAGSIAGQIAGNATGIQKGFSWKQVALSAVSGGVSGGLSGMDITGSGIASSMGNNIARAALGSAIGQGIGIATGAQDHFSWKTVAASAAGAGVGSAVAQGINGTDFARATGNFGVGAVSSFAGGLTTATLQGGRIAVGRIAADAFGNALGSSLAEGSSSSGQPALTTGDFARMDGESYRSMPYDIPNAAGGLGRSSYGLQLTPGAVTAMDDGILDVRGQKILVAMRDAEIDAAAAADIALARQSALRTAWTGGAGGGRGFVNPADASTYGAYPFAGRSTITDPGAYGTRLSGLDAGKASVGIEKELQSLMRSQPDSPQGWAARGNALADLTTRYQSTMQSAGLQPDPVLLTTMGFQRSIAKYQVDGDVSQLAGSAVASGVILGMETGPSGGGVRADASRLVTNSAGQAVTRTVVQDQDSLLRAAEKAAGGSLDNFTNYKPDWWQSANGARRIEWNPIGHANTNEGPHVTVRDFNGRRYEVTQKYFIEGQEKWK